MKKILILLSVLFIVGCEERVSKNNGIKRKDRHYTLPDGMGKFTKTFSRKNAGNTKQTDCECCV